MHIRLSKNLLAKYKAGVYKNYINDILNNIKHINGLGLKYPANAKPVFYLYIVPDDNFKELLGYPLSRAASITGSKPVTCYDLDGFNTALGMSSNYLENRGSINIMATVGNIHELAHLVHNMFFRAGEWFLAEGFAEALPLYVMDYENKFDKHREALKSLSKNQLLSAQQLMGFRTKDSFNGRPIIPNGYSGYDQSYISSYLFVRGCLEMIADKFKLNRAQATQKLLEIIKFAGYGKQWLVMYLADQIGVSQKDLLEGTDMQFDVIKQL